MARVLGTDFQENGASRVLAGIHFTSAVRTGYLQGERVAHFAHDRLLRPLAAAPPARANVAGN
jgi:hypothetical protein